MQNNPKDYYLNSGGAQGADLAWVSIGEEFGIPKDNIKHWRPNDYLDADEMTRDIIALDVKLAALDQGRPDNFKGINLVKRNWFQVHNADGVFAIGRIIDPGKHNAKGFINKAKKQIVDGGTGWAIEMAIQATKIVYVFDMNSEHGWHYWNYDKNTFDPLIIKRIGLPHTPVLDNHFAGIGSREITPEGINAIRNVYKATFQ